MDRDAGDSSPVVLRPDPLHRMPGRGAWVHPVPGCFEMAVRRKAFGRALRLQAAVDVSAVAQHLDIQRPQENGGGPTAGRRQSEIRQRTNKAG